MINFIKIYWKPILGITLCIIGFIGLNHIALAYTHGSYNAFEIMFM